MEYGILEENRRSGLAIALINQMILQIKRHSITRMETSWVLEENRDSDGICQAICDGRHKNYVTYEKEI